MPSLPTSLIVVGLVVAWLVVLVPMVARRREEVPKNTEEGANFRVLHRNSAAGPHRPIFSRTAMAHRSRSDEHLDSDGTSGGGSDDAVDDVRSHDARDIDARGDVGDLGDDADARAAVDDHLHGVTVASGSRETADFGSRVSAAAFTAANEKYDADFGADRESDRDVRRPRRSADDDRYESDVTGEQLRPARATGDAVRGLAGGPAFEPAAADEGEFRRTPIRHGRGGFDPAAADRARVYRFRQRRRVALALAVIAVVGIATGLLGTAYGYLAAVAGGVLLVLYLAYLRRQVRVENEIRDRRAARLARARQIRPGYRPSVAEQVYAHRTGEIPRPGAVPEYHFNSHARETVPPGGYGEPVDLEDSDPAFDDLEYYRPAAYGRRAG